MFDTKIVFVVRDDLATWRKLNVTAFLMSGITAANPDIIGETYRDRDGISHLPMSKLLAWLSGQTKRSRIK